MFSRRMNPLGLPQVPACCAVVSVTRRDDVENLSGPARRLFASTMLPLIFLDKVPCKYDAGLISGQVRNPQASVAESRPRSCL